MEVLRTSKRRIPCDYYACMGRYLDSRRYTKVQVVSYCLYTFGLGCALAAIAFFMASCHHISIPTVDDGSSDTMPDTILLDSTIQPDSAIQNDGSLSPDSGFCCSSYTEICEGEDGRKGYAGKDCTDCGAFTYLWCKESVCKMAEIGFISYEVCGEN